VLVQSARVFSNLEWQTPSLSSSCGIGVDQLASQHHIGRDFSAKNLNLTEMSIGGLSDRSLS